MAFDAQKWAEGLIRQLPAGHEGRNSWLLNHGSSDEAKNLRKLWNEEARLRGSPMRAEFRPISSAEQPLKFLNAAYTESFIQ